MFGYCVALIFILYHQSFCTIVPEQIRLAYGDTPYEMVVTWSTENNTDESNVKYGIGNLMLLATGSAPTLFSSPPTGSETDARDQYIHRVKLPNLTPNSKYFYSVGSGSTWSEQFWFTTPPAEDEPWSPQLAVYGDLGVENAVTLMRLEKEAQLGFYDAIIHAGDFAYDFYMDSGRYADRFFKLIEPIAAHVPYMVAPGNHEEAHNFSHYRNLFTMPGGTENLWFSFNMGPIHFISISTEVYYYLWYGVQLVSKQYNWLEQDLKEATSAYNRTLRPWIIAFGHRPMYCSTANSDDCNIEKTLLRVGVDSIGGFGLEDLFYNYGVDLLLWAHEHNYERFFPVYQYKMYNGSYEEPYRNPGAPVHITTGSAGCSEGHDHFRAPTNVSAFQSTDYGFARMKVYNTTHLYLEQVSEDKGGVVIDSIWLIKDTHGPYQTKKSLVDEAAGEIKWEPAWAPGSPYSPDVSPWGVK